MARASAFAVLAGLTGGVLPAGAGPQSALDPAGPQAASLAWLIWLFFAVCGVVWLLVMLMTVLAVRRRGTDATPAELPGPERDRRMTRVVVAAVGATVLVITGLTLASFLATRRLHAAAEDALVVRLRGYQWWWEVTYPDPDPQRIVTTANEIRVPVGRPVRIELSAADVIHSFWVPALAGKQDLIPGRDNAITVTAERPGLYRGQCAEFCGIQHARMALTVVALPPAEFDAWRVAQRADAPAPRDAEEALGLAVATGKACAACHTIRGTSAAGTLGPDLTHVASRGAIAAGTLPTTRGSLAAWIADPQTVKPGNRMPMVPLSADELRAVSAYLAALQ